MAAGQYSNRPRRNATFERISDLTRTTQKPVPRGHRPTAAPVVVLLLAATVLMTTVTPAAANPRGTAPLDTLETPAPSTAMGNLSISRRTLPDVSTTVVPRQAPPAVPPRLDAPNAGERLFLSARHAADAGLREQADNSIRAALEARPNDSRIPLWQVMQALRDRDPGAVVWHLPGALRAVLGDPLAAPRLAVQAHQAAILLLAVFWTLLAIAGLAAWWRPLSHDLSALIFRNSDHRLRLWTPWLLIVGVILARPGWLGGLAVISIPLLLEARGRSRALLVATWLVALGLTFPNWPPLRASLPVLDPHSETTLLACAAGDDASPTMIRDLHERLAGAENPARRQRLRLALGLQEARRGRYSASNEHLRAVLSQRPDDVVALVAMANNSYFTSRFDEALAGYDRARVLAPERGEIPYNMAQVYFKKLFVPEAGAALEDARNLGFDPSALREGVRGGADFSPAVYLTISRADLRASARREADQYLPLAHLSAWNYYLGAPPLPLFILLGGLFAVALVLTYWGSVQDSVRRCDNCGAVLCRDCASERDGSWLCRECTDTADRSRSEMVLATLMKNRSRTVGLANTARMVLMARLIPGSAFLVTGDTARAMIRLSAAALAVFMIGCGWAFDPSSAWTSPGLALAEETIHSLWLPLPTGAWPGFLAWPVVAGWILLAIVYVVALMDGTRLRFKLPEHFVQVHAGPTPGPGRA